MPVDRRGQPAQPGHVDLVGPAEVHQHVGPLQGQLDIAEERSNPASPDAGVVKSVLRRVLDKIGETGSTMLDAALTAYAKHLMLQAGVPLEPGQ
ncbi:hypothetical protein GCM10027610_071550 [Dactylosporangium cerinum]